MIRPLHAWGDESIRSHGLDGPAYLLGASIVDSADADAVRDRLRSLRGADGRKLHWYELDRRHRARVVDVVTTLAASHVVVIARPMDLPKQERARSACLERLVWELAGRAASLLTLEARPTALMARDRRAVDTLRIRGVLPPTMRVEHGHPSDEPLLWLPDQVLGMVGACVAGGSSLPEPLDVDVVEIKP
ncbi:hypothetical protein AAEP80_05290 [Curtobacterium sp. L3-7]|jgi:hypothetical protein|uniref:hypothetical protein n=1 Tax=Curtobacterium sp. L3-7 TaxID=3138787 RepID=UPI003B51C284